MRTSTRWAGWLLVCVLGAAVACGGDDDDDIQPTPDAMPVVTPDATPPDAAPPDALSGVALRVTVTGGGAGTVTSDPPGISCPPDCNAGYDPGTEVTLTAAAGAGASFEGWGGDCAQDGDAGITDTCALTMDAEKLVTAELAGGGALDAIGFGGGQVDWPYGVATDGSGARVVGGFFGGTVDFGDGDVAAIGAADLFIARYTDATALDWVVTAGVPAQYAFALSVQTDGDDNVIAAGQFQGSINFGGPGDGLSAVLFDAFLVKLTSAGDHVWSKQFGGVGADSIFDMAIDADGGVAVVGVFGGTANFGGDDLTADGERDLFVAKYDADGNHLWSDHHGPGSADAPLNAGIAIDTDGNVVIATSFLGTVNFGGDDLTSAGSEDIVVAKYASDDGAHVWSKRFGGGQLDSVTAIATVNGDAVIAGAIHGSVSFGGAAVSAGGQVDIGLARLAADDGSQVWAHAYGGPGDEVAWRMAPSESGQLLLAGSLNGQAASLGGRDLQSNGGDDAFAARFDPADGGLIWGRGFGSIGDDIGTDVALLPNGDLALIGVYGAGFAFGADALEFGGGFDGFVAELGP